MDFAACRLGSAPCARRTTTPPGPRSTCSSTSSSPRTTASAAAWPRRQAARGVGRTPAAPTGPGPTLRDLSWQLPPAAPAFPSPASRYLVLGSLLPPTVAGSALCLEDPAVLGKLASFKTPLDYFCYDNTAGVISGPTFPSPSSTSCIQNTWYIKFISTIYRIHGSQTIMHCTVRCTVLGI